MDATRLTCAVQQLHRITTEKLPETHVARLDEVFTRNITILNASSRSGERRHSTAAKTEHYGHVTLEEKNEAISAALGLSAARKVSRRER